MLTESFIASSTSPVSLTSGTTPTHLRDASIFYHTYKPTSRLSSTLKKSSTSPNNLCISSTHIFAIQAGKATINIYKRSTNAHEQTIHLPARLSAGALACNESVLCLGTEEGGLFLWELATGRCVNIPNAHLDPVKHVEGDANGLFLFTAAEDPVSVWSLRSLLSFNQSSNNLSDSLTPHTKLSAHTDRITAIAAGHSTAIAGTGICVTASKDRTVIVWAYETGIQLRTFLLSSPATCLVLDPADRAVFAGHEDGSISCLPFYSNMSGTSGKNPVNSSNILSATLATTPIQPPPSWRWTHGAANASAVKCIDVNYTGTALLTGHESGRISEWNVGDARYVADVAEYAGASITNLIFLRPTGWPEVPSRTRSDGQGDGKTRKWRLDKIVKPRIVPGDVMDENYTFTAEFVGQLQTPGQLHGPRQRNSGSSVSDAILSTGFPIDMVEDAIAGLSETSLAKAPNELEADYMSLDDGTKTTNGDSAEEVQKLQRQIDSLKKQQETSRKQMQMMAQERIKMIKERQEYMKTRIDEGEEEVDSEDVEMKV